MYVSDFKHHRKHCHQLLEINRCLLTDGPSRVLAKLFFAMCLFEDVFFNLYTYSVVNDRQMFFHGSSNSSGPNTEPCRTPQSERC